MGKILQPSYISYLEEDKIQNLRLYKYAAVDKSFISRYVLKHYWDFAITLFPRWIAPNLITLIGLFFMIANVTIACIYTPSLGTDGPNWINFSFALGLWLYSTFDNVDGRQARRTGTSSPLGELFDHGCDAVNCTYVALLQCAALGLGHSINSAILLFVTILGFYLSTAEEYYTGVLYLGYVNGPTEGIIVTCLAFIWSGVYGVASWHVPISEISCVSFLTHLLPSNTTFSEIFVWAMVLLFLVTHLPVCLYAIIQVCREKKLSTIRVLGRIFGPILITSGLITLWLTTSTSIVFKDEHFILFSIFVGFLFGEMTSDIILAHLTKSEFPHFRDIYYALFVMVVIEKWNYYLPSYALNEFYVLLGLTIGTLINFIVRAIRVINAFCIFLNIRCLVIPYPNKNVLPITVTNEEAESLLVAQSGSTYQTI